MNISLMRLKKIWQRPKFNYNKLVQINNSPWPWKFNHLLNLTRLYLALSIKMILIILCQILQDLWVFAAGKSITVWKIQQFPVTQDFTWNQFWRMSKFKKCHFCDFRGSETMILLHFSLLENAKNHKKLKFRASQCAKMAVFVLQNS